ncbi:hypothetical protein ACJJTC_004291 [Scirpophaga incertulas]
MCYLTTLLMVVILSVCDVTLGLSGKGNYCRDPDTGKLYAVNSTWTATSFCGNYTCKIRRKSRTDIKVPIREFVVNVSITKNSTEKSLEHLNNTGTEETPSTSKNTTPLLKNEETNDKIIDRTNDEELKQTKSSSDTEDRYLTEDEVNILSQLLRHIKKSDLEAIVDIYNLAQEVYKQIDTETENSEAQSTEPSNENVKNKHYWYEPLHLNDKPDVNTESPMTQALNLDKISYFQEPLVRKGVGVLPYHKPLSNFQRQASYKQQPITNMKPCDTERSKIFPVIPSQENEVYRSLVKKPFMVHTQRPIQPSVLLPYPFSNMRQKDTNSIYPNSGKLDANLQKTKFYEHNSKKNTPMMDTYANIPRVGNTNHKTFYRMNKGERFFDTIFENHNVETRNTAKWQRDALSVNVLDELKAHYDAKMKFTPLTLKNMKKIEKMGNGVIANEVGIKTERNSENQNLHDGDMFEVYFEKTLCRSELELGFYKMGNLSQPYPACCPQKIEEHMQFFTSRTL